MQQLGYDMFTAMVMACAIGVATNGCTIATDELGPYETKLQCLERVDEMVLVLKATLPIPHKYSFKCEEYSITKEGINL
jgi:hypothetical protein|tara:strand:- start:944 stop:1180 length:237 start_codon:yes stop_codon:yes gene_type:complete